MTEDPLCDPPRPRPGQRGVDLATIETQILRAAPKAWRWVAEMQEISAALESVNMPGEFHQAAATVYERLARFKDTASPELAHVLSSMA